MLPGESVERFLFRTVPTGDIDGLRAAVDTYIAEWDARQKELTKVGRPVGWEDCPVHGKPLVQRIYVDLAGRFEELHTVCPVCGRGRHRGSTFEIPLPS